MTTATQVGGVWAGAGKRIHMQEVGLRDGLQIAILSFTQGSLDNRIGRPVDDHRDNNQHQ